MHHCNEKTKENNLEKEKFILVLLFDVVGWDERFDVYAGTLRVFVIKNEEH